MLSFKKIFTTHNYHPQLIESILKSNFSGAILVNIIIPIIIWYLFSDFIPSMQMDSWLSVQGAIFILRLTLHKQIGQNLNIHFVLLCTTSLLYAILAWQTAIYGDEVHLLLLAMIIASIVAGSIATLISIYYIFFSFVLIQLLGLITAFLYVKQDIFYLSALLATTFLDLVLKNGYKQYKMLKTTLFLHQQINELLDNTSEGFLSFDKEFLCHKSYSKECTNIFAIDSLENRDICLLLFHDEEQRELFSTGIQRAMGTDDMTKIELFVSLLPHESIVHDKTIKIEYKYLNKNRFMLILKDISQTKLLQERLAYQSKVQNMLLNVSTNKNDFFDLKNSFEKMLQQLESEGSGSLNIIQNIKKELHTFKGNFSQKGFIHITSHIHALELKIKHIASKKDTPLSTTSISEDLRNTFNKDIKLIEKALGDNFLNTEKEVAIEYSCIDALKEDLKALLLDAEYLQQRKIYSIIHKIDSLKNISVYQELKPYKKYVQEVANRLEKDIAPLEIEGDRELKIPPRFHTFFKSLIHLFNNSVDHGIEDMQIRDERGKEQGKIQCSYETLSNIFILKISDDGGGIDTQSLVKKAIDAKIITQEEAESMSEKEQCNLVFKESLSSKEKISSLSGIGIGMSAIFSEVQKLEGKVGIENRRYEGVTFIFTMPLYPQIDIMYNDENSCEHIAKILLNQSSHFLQNALELEQPKIESTLNLPLNLHSASLELFEDFNALITLFYSQELNLSFCKHLFGSICEEENNTEILQEVANEVLNTLVGLSLKDIDKNIGNILMSAPKQYLPSKIQELWNQSECKSAYSINTPHGELCIAVIEKKKRKL